MVFHACQALSYLQGNVQVVRLDRFHLPVILQGLGQVAVQFVALGEMLVGPDVVRQEQVGMFIVPDSLCIPFLLLEDVSGFLVHFRNIAVRIHQFLVERIGFFPIFFL